MKIHFFCYSAYIQRRIGTNTKRNAKVLINDKNGKDTKSYKLVIDSAVLQGVFLNLSESRKLSWYTGRVLAGCKGKFPISAK